MFNDHFTKTRSKRVKELSAGGKLNNEEWLGLAVWMLCMIVIAIIISKQTK